VCIGRKDSIDWIEKNSLPYKSLPYFVSLLL
jgi:hypothetical protein